LAPSGAGFLKVSVLAPKGAIHLLNENIRYDIVIVYMSSVIKLSAAMLC
jgi:hypothetical protein